MKKLAKSVSFLAIGVVIFAAIQGVLIPNWKSIENVDCVVHTIQLLKPNTVDVLYLGPSHVEFGISPMKIYEDKKICSYNLGSPGQTIECSYYMLKYAVQQQKPKVVMVDASSLFYADTDLWEHDASWRYLIHNIPVGTLKMEMAKAYCELYDDTMTSVVFPIVKYHSRWAELTVEDFQFSTGSTPYYSAGEWLYTLVNAAGLTVDYSNTVADEMIRRNYGYISYFDGQSVKQGNVEQTLYAPIIQNRNIEYLLKMKQLCEENNTELALIKIPSLADPPLQKSAWTKEKSRCVKQLAEQYQLPFFDLMYDYDDVVDFSVDTGDSGKHLNVRGAEKVSVLLADILERVFQISGRPNSQYDVMLTDYQKARGIAMLETETDFVSYLNRLARHKEDWTIFISASNEYTFGMAPSDYALTEELLGLKLISDGRAFSSYMAVIDRGSLLYEAVSDRRIDHTMDVNGRTVSLSSSNWYTFPYVSVEIDGREYVQGNIGLNIVVLDNESGLVIDSVGFETSLPGKPAYRNGSNINDYFRAYESAVCFE